MYKSTPKIIVVLFFLFLSSSFAQKEVKNFIGGNFGISDFHLKDIHASPLIYSGTNSTPSFQYFYNEEISRHYFEATYSFNPLTTLSDNLNTSTDIIRFRYSYVHSSTDFDFLEMKFSLFGGGSVGTFLSLSNYYQDQQIILPRIKIMKSWYWSHSLDISLQLIHELQPRQFFSLQLFIPLLSNVSRPQYSPSADFNYPELDWKLKMFGKTKFIIDNFSVNTILTFQSPLYLNFNYQLSYEFFYSTYSEPKEVSMFMNSFRAGLFFCF
ncbi:hypothetical protein APF79_02045 [bacterium BRH_c32]|nr:MAG: hypothetical protein APF79_02045 [bacterium BRH_c32]